MTAPEDDLENALRQALSAAVDGVEPGSDGLERIRARTSRPPRPWLIAMAGAVVERGRNWVWRGHWAWPRYSPPANVCWIRPVAVLVGAGLIAAVTLAVTPLRQAVVQASSAVLTGGQTTAVLGTDTDGSGTLTGDSSQRDLSSPGGAGAAGRGNSAPAASGGTQCLSVKQDSAAAEASASASPGAGVVNPDSSAIPSALPFATPSPAQSRSPAPCATSASATATATPAGSQPETSPSAAPASPAASQPSAAASPPASPSSSPGNTPSPSPSTGTASSPAASPAPSASGAAGNDQDPTESSSPTVSGTPAG